LFPASGLNLLLTENTRTTSWPYSSHTDVPSVEEKSDDICAFSLDACLYRGKLM
jgi:hypothetical protein